MTAHTRTLMLPVKNKYNENLNDVYLFLQYFSLENFRNGFGNRDEWSTICFRLTFGSFLASRYFTSDAETILASALDALCDVQDYNQGRDINWVIKPSQINEIICGLETTDQMCRLTTRKEHIATYLKTEAFFKRNIKHAA